MRYLTRLTVSAVTILTLAACGSSPQGDAVTGTVTWSDGHLAANAQVYWYVGGYSLASPADYAISLIGADGSYSIGGCPCSPLTGYLFVPSTYGADPLNGGRDCWIILQARGTYQGITANPSDVIDWQALDMPCAAHMYRSDQSDVQQEALMLNPATNGGERVGGDWLAAGARVQLGILDVDLGRREDALAAIEEAIRARVRSNGGIASAIRPALLVGEGEVAPRGQGTGGPGPAAAPGRPASARLVRSPRRSVPPPGRRWRGRESLSVMVAAMAECHCTGRSSCRTH